jgi:hypothetical protein
MTADGISTSTIVLASTAIVCATTLVQLIVGYGFKALFDRKDAKIAALETRLGDLETQRITVLETTVKEGFSDVGLKIDESKADAAARRRSIYDRLQGTEAILSDLKARVVSVEDKVPQLTEISRTVAGAVATLKHLTDRVDGISAQQLQTAKDMGRLQGKVTGSLG